MDYWSVDIRDLKAEVLEKVLIAKEVIVTYTESPLNVQIDAEKYEKYLHCDLLL